MGSTGAGNAGQQRIGAAHLNRAVSFFRLL